MANSQTLITKPQKDYELIDSGEGEKLERYGSVILSRPDPQALWFKNKPNEWKKADAIFSRSARDAGWEFGKNVPNDWTIGLGGLKFLIKPSAFKHVGVFPEQVGNWEWLDSRLRGNDSAADSVKVLNLFGYTGGATLACAKAGAEVCHVDGSKVAITWARENARLSGLEDKPVRWILDDAVAFVRREIKRDRKYDGIIMDPPAFGHGPEGELWKIETDFLPFLEMCFEILSEKPLFFLINGYASGYSSLAYENCLRPLIKKFGGEIEKGELAIEESKNGRLLPCGIFARWYS
jgi:23S rRNA (cytosine1962-C5)-methyltransferase